MPVELGKGPVPLTCAHELNKRIYDAVVNPGSGSCISQNLDRCLMPLITKRELHLHVSAIKEPKRRKAHILHLSERYTPIAFKLLCLIYQKISIMFTSM